MSAFLYATGEQFNSLERMVAALTVTNEDAELIRARLFDRDPGLAFRFGSVVANLAITADLNILPNGDMETDGGAGLPPASWSEVLVGAGDVTRGTGAGEMDDVGGGAAGLKLTVGASGSAEAYQDRYVRAGERIIVKARAKDAGAGVIKARLRNKRTGKSATSGGSWSAAQVDFATYDTTAWGDFFTAFEIVVEDMAVCQADRVQLRLSFVNDTINTSKFVDNVAWWPASDVFSIHGHGIPPEILVEWRSSSDNFGTSNVLNGSAKTPFESTFYNALLSAGARSTLRYQRLLLPGTPFDTTPPWLGEWILTQGTVASRNPNFGFVETRSLEQIRSEGPAGKIRVYPLADKTRRAISFPVSLRSAADYAQFRDDLMERSQHGRWPVLVISEDDDPRAALYGIVPAEFAHTRRFLTIRDTDLRIIEAPFPTYL